jgi:hypothetical protein
VDDRAVRRQERIPCVNGFSALTSRKRTLICFTRCLLLALAFLGVDVAGLLRGHGLRPALSCLPVRMKINPKQRIARNFLYVPGSATAKRM